MRAPLPLLALLLPLSTLAQQAPPVAPPAPLAVAAPAPPPAPPAPPAPAVLHQPDAPPAPPVPASPAPPAPPALPAEVQAVAAAVEDYLLAFYDAEPARLERSLHPDLQKVGFWRSEDGAYHYAEMSYDQALALAARWNADGSRTSADSPRAIAVLEVNDQTAIAKLTAVWGIDYVQLGKYDGQWKIIHVLWQSPPSAGE